MTAQVTSLSKGWNELLRRFANNHLPAARLTARLQGEGQAHRLLKDRLGEFTDDDVRKFLRVLNADFTDGKERQNRFMPAFYGALANQIVEAREAFNFWARRIWQSTEDEIDTILDEFWQKGGIAGGGTSLPTAFLYLRDPESYSIWIPAMENGLKLVLPNLKLKRRSTAEGYRVYNSAVQNVREQVDLTPQAMDIVLTLASKEADAVSDDEFQRLFHEFTVNYVDTPQCQKHLHCYEPLRVEAQGNWNRILEMQTIGQDVTDAVLMKLLPHQDTEHNRNTGRWVHVAPSVTRDIKQWFEGAGWTKREDWPEVSKAILAFIKKCVEQPDDLAEHCSWFAEIVPSKGFQMGMLTPILNCLAPQRFNIINNKPRQTLNYLCGTGFQNSLQEYPQLNQLAFTFQETHQDALDEVGQGVALRGDVFDLFSHWLVAVKKFDFKVADVYKISPGSQAWNWDACRDEGYVAIGWDELGDLSAASQEEFDRRRDILLQKHSDWTKSQLGQVWRFSQIREGDRIIANKGKTEILGFGTVIGPYYFVANTKHGHRLPVIWDDLTRRKVNEPSWSGTLQKLNATRFKELRDAEPIADVDSLSSAAPPIATIPTNPTYTIELCSEETGFSVEQLERWLSAIDRKRQAIFFGPPGTGKTFLAEKLAKHLVGGTDGLVDIVQFHPEYAYQDFIMGIRPITTGEGLLRYDRVDGVFKVFCTKAESCKGRCVLLIDEINRANLSRVFGELMYLLEYRDRDIELAGGSRFRIPDNVRIIGTMNTADRSIALVDYALRRRFAFLRLAPDFEILRKAHASSSFDVSGLVEVLEELNRQINDPHYEIGITFFLADNLEDEIEDIWRMEIEPYLEEYFFDHPAKAGQYSWEAVKERIEA